MEKHLMKTFGGERRSLTDFPLLLCFAVRRWQRFKKAARVARRISFYRFRQLSRWFSAKPWLSPANCTDNTFLSLRNKLLRPTGEGSF